MPGAASSEEPRDVDLPPRRKLRRYDVEAALELASAHTVDDVVLWIHSCMDNRV